MNVNETILKLLKRINDLQCKNNIFKVQRINYV